MFIPSGSIANQINQTEQKTDKKITLASLKIDDTNKTKQETKTDTLVNKTNPSKIPSTTIDFTKVEQKTDSDSFSPLADKIADSANETVENKVSYKDMAILDYGNLACAFAVSNILNKLPEFKNVTEMECSKLSQTLTKKGFDNVYNPIVPEKKEASDFKVGDVVFFPRTTEQYGLKKMGHVGIVTKDKQTGELMLVNNGYEVYKENDKYQSESRVHSVPLVKYLEEREVTMILRHK